MASRAKIKFLSSLIALIGSTPLCSADMLSELSCHDKVIDSGIHNLHFASEVEKLFGASNVDHFISDFRSKAHTPVWNSVTHFEGRYTLTLQVPIAIDYQQCRFTGVVGKLFVQINETVRVSFSKSGIAGAEEKGQWRLEELGWRRLVDNKGDWSAVNIPIRTNASVPGFEEFIEQKRSPIRDRKRNFDDQIRKTLEDLRHSKSGSASNSTKEPFSATKTQFQCYEDVLRNGIDTLALPAEVDSMFGASNVDHFVSKFGSGKKRPVWHSVAYFGGRYRLWLQVPISIDSSLCKVRGAINSAMVQIDEISEVNPKNPSLAGATIKQQWHLGEPSWKLLVKSQGDWSVVQIAITTNKVVAGFDDYAKRERTRPVEQRQKEYDSLVRQDIDNLPYPTAPP